MHCSATFSNWNDNPVILVSQLEPGAAGGFPLLHEYEFSRDREDTNPHLPAVLRPSVNLRPYQQRALPAREAANRCEQLLKALISCNSLGTAGRFDNKQPSEDQKPNVTKLFLQGLVILRCLVQDVFLGRCRQEWHRGVALRCREDPGWHRRVLSRGSQGLGVDHHGSGCGPVAQAVAALYHVATGHWAESCGALVN